MAGMLRVGRPDPGQDDPGRARTAVRHRRAGRAGSRRAADATPAARRSDRRRGLVRPVEQVEVAIVGGGPAGAALAARLADAGREVVVLERSPTWRWRAAGSSLARGASRRCGGSASTTDTLRAVARPIPAMRVETSAGTAFRLTYGADDGGEPAVGFDRSRLDPALLELARDALAPTSGRARPSSGVDLRARRGHGPRTRRARRRSCGRPWSSGPTASAPSSRGAAGVARPARLRPRVGLTYHLEDVGGPTAARRPDVPCCATGTSGSRRSRAAGSTSGSCSVQSWRPALARAGRGGRRPTRSSRRSAPIDDDAGVGGGSAVVAMRSPGPGRSAIASRGGWRDRRDRPPGRGWLLVGDAAGFLDPFTGEGLHRALVSAELAAAGASWRTPGDAATRSRRTNARCSVGSWRRTASRGSSSRSSSGRGCSSTPRGGWRSRATVRATMGLVMGDLVPAESRARSALPRRAPRALTGRAPMPTERAERCTARSRSTSMPRRTSSSDSRATSSAGSGCCPTTSRSRVGRAPGRRAAGRRLRGAPAVRRRPRARPAGRLAGADLVRARRPAAFASSTSPGATKGMDVTWRIEPTRGRLPRRRSSTTSAPRAARVRARSSIAASPGRSPGGRWRRSRRSPRRWSSRWRRPRRVRSGPAANPMP